MSEQKKEYAPQLGFWPPKNEGGKSMGSCFIDAKVLETLKKAENGGRLVLTEVPEHVREEYPNSPRFRITFFAADAEERAPRGNSNGGKRPFKPKQQDSDSL
jgi:hypothetical protein